MKRDRFQLEVITDDEGSHTVIIRAMGEADPNSLAHATSQLMVFVAKTCDVGFDKGLEMLVEEAKTVNVSYMEKGS